MNQKRPDLQETNSADQALKHENFIVPEEIKIRRKIIRQDRLPVPTGKCFVYISQIKSEVLNISTFGLAAILFNQDYEKLKAALEGSELLQASFVFGDTLTQTLDLRAVRIENHPQSVFGDKIIAFEVVSEALNVDRIKALETVMTVIEQQQNFEKLTASIPEKFKLLVYEMKEWLVNLKIKIDELEVNAPVDSGKDNQEFRETIAESTSDYIGKVIPSHYLKIPEMFKGMNEDTVKTCTQFIRQQLGILIMGAPFANRAYYKPRGYAGDYEMMNHLYRGETVGRTLFDQCMHKYFIEEPAGRAVKNRCDYLHEKIKQTVRESNSDVIRIMAVASGPAVEQQLFLKNSKEFSHKKIEFYCVDQDEESLKHAQREIQTLERFAHTKFSFKFINSAIKNIIIKGTPEKDFDLVYTAGLFDYFTDAVAQAASLKLYESVKSGGRLIIGNFSKDNPTQTLMELLLDWYLIYRSEDDLRRLFEVVDKNLKVEKEELGINLFAVMTK